MRLVGIVPAAGYGTRLGLVTGSKETVEVSGRPVMDYLIERMKLLEPDSIRVVTRPAKIDVIQHAEELGLEVILAETESASHSIAVGSDDLNDDDLVLIGFPDSIWEPIDGFRTLYERISPEWPVVLGLFTSEAAERADVVVVGESGVVLQILAKPSPPPSNTIWACAVSKKWALVGMRSFEYPGEHFARLSVDGLVGAVWLSDQYVDIGTREALAATHLRPDAPTAGSIGAEGAKETATDDGG